MNVSKTSKNKRMHCILLMLCMVFTMLPMTAFAVAEFTITFNANGGTCATETATTADGKLTNLPTPTLDGHTFNGWYTAATGGDKVDETTVYTENTTLYAQWTHNYGTDWKSDSSGHWHECSCGDKADFSAHTPGEEATETTPPTCTEGGYTTHTCTVCGGSYTDTPTDATGHTWEEIAAVASTCTEKGNNHYWHCTACNKYFKDDKTTETTAADETLPLADHTYTVVVTAPTCTKNGYTTYTCTACDHSYKANYTNIIDHSFGEWAHVEGTNTHTRACSACEAVETGNCEFADTATTPPTCTEGGYTTHTCSACGNSYTDTPTEATGHSFGEWAHVEGTNTHAKACSACEAVETENCEFTATITDPTCIKDGYTTHTCTVCGDSYTDTPTDATGHSLGEWHFDGTKIVRSCACGKTESIFQYAWILLVRAFTAVWLPIVLGFDSLWL